MSSAMSRRAVSSHRPTVPPSTSRAKRQGSLRRTEARLLLLLNDLSADRQGCYLTVGQLAAHLKMPLGTADNVFFGLRIKGYVRQTLTWSFRCQAPCIPCCYVTPEGQAALAAYGRDE